MECGNIWWKCGNQHICSFTPIPWYCCYTLSYSSIVQSEFIMTISDSTFWSLRKVILNGKLYTNINLGKITCTFEPSAMTMTGWRWWMWHKTHLHHSWKVVHLVTKMILLLLLLRSLCIASHCMRSINNIHVYIDVSANQVKWPLVDVVIVWLYHLIFL